MIKRIDGWCLLILGLYIVLGVAYSLVVPLAEAPDELDHFRYIQYLVLTGEYPTLQGEPEANYTLEANQPPLYYLFNTAVLRLLPWSAPADFPKNICYSFDPADLGRQHFYLHDSAEQVWYRGTYLAFHLARFLSVLMGAGTVWLTYGLARQVAPHNRHLPLLAMSLLAFNPQFIFITASVNNDVLTTLLGAVIVFVSVQLAGAPSPRTAGWLGFLLGLGFLTKFALFAFWPLAALAVLWPVGVQYGRERQIRPFLLPLLHLSLVLLLPLLVAGWWYWRTHLLYGDPLAWALHLQAKWTLVRPEPLTTADLVEFVQIHFQSYWALFGWLSIQAPAWVYGLLAVFMATAGLGLAGELKNWRLEIKRAQLVPLAFNLLAVLAVYASLLRYIQTINWSGYQGRLAYVGAASMAVLMAVGWQKVAERFWAHRAGLFTGVTSAVFFLFSVGSLFGLMIPAYPRPQIYQPGPGVQQVCARFTSGLMLEGYQLPEQVTPGEETAVTLYGYGMIDAPAPQDLVAQVVNPDGRVVGQASEEINWQAGEVVSVTLQLPISTDAPPSRSILVAGLQNPDGNWQTATSTTGRVLDLAVGWQTLKVKPIRPLLPTPQYPLIATFGDQLALIGYDLLPQNETVTVTLYWQAIAPMTQDYTTFLHVLNETGELWAQADSQPHGGLYPTSVWDVGEMVADVKTVQIPADGAYQLAVGVYQLDTLERLPVDNAGGELQNSNLLFLPND